MVQAVLVVAVVVIAIAVFLLLGAVGELMEDLQQLREHSGLIDRPVPIDLGNLAGTAPSRYGLPTALDTAVSAAVLFLSEKCGTCRSVAVALSGRVPPMVWLVLEAGEGQGEQWLVKYDLAGDQSILDDDSAIAVRLGLDITPAVLYVENGKLSRASTVPSSRQLFAMMPAAHGLKGSVAAVGKERDD